MKKQKVPFLPQEIISNILKRLPVKSLLRFQRICKHWKNLIASPSFITDHVHHPGNQNRSVLFKRRGADPLDVFVVDSSEMRARDIQKPSSISNLPDASIIGSCNGLICVRSGSRVFLWNPAIGEVRGVPGVTNDGHDDYDFVFGFGFSPVLNDYTIVKILKPHDEIERVEAYSLSIDSWREIELGKLIRVPGFRRDVLNVSANGSIFWYVVTDDGGGWQKRLVSFDMAKQVFSWVNLPVEMRDSYVLSVHVHCEELVFFSSPAHGWNEEHEGIGFRSDMWLWVMMKDDEKWSWRKIDNGDPLSSFFYSRITTMMDSSWECGVTCFGLFGESLVPILNLQKGEK